MVEAIRRLPGAYFVGVLCFMAFLIGGYLPQDPPLPLESGALSSALAGTPEAAMVSHAIIACLALAGSMVLTLRRKVLTLPSPKVTLVVLLFGLVTVASVFVSRYRMTSLAAAVEWASYLAVFFLAISSVGRKEGPKVVLAAISIGGFVMALRGIGGVLTKIYANWRIFAGWVHPNVAAAALTLGAVVSLALIPLGMRWLGVVSCLSQSAAVFLTGSKGGTLGLLIGLTATALLALITREPLKTKGVFLGLALLSTLGGLFVGNQLQSVQSGRLKIEATTRIVAGSQTSEQSGGFRTLLWKTSLDLMKKYPLGTGIGTFKYHSAETGRTTQTQMAHSSPLQIGVETGWLGLGLALAVIGIWLVEVGRGLRSAIPVPVTRAALMGSVLAVLAHSVVDSNLQHFGLGFLFFVVLAIGVNSSVDGTTPEFSRAHIRWPVLGVSALTLVAMLIVAWNETALSKSASLLTSDREEVSQALSPLYALDHRAQILLALSASSADQALTALETASKVGPTLRGFRLQSQVYSSKNDHERAIQVLNAALQLDPNNLPTLERLLEEQAKVDTDFAIATAKRMVEIEENSTYFKVRAIPELVPLETVVARLFLVENGAPGRDHLPRAEALLMQFLSVTVPRGLPAIKANFPLPGMSVSELTRGIELSRKTIQLLEREGQPSGELKRATDQAEASIASAVSESQTSFQ
ncbi:MAG TPA: O-antigen ligase family protein [Fimbriimonadaceae bacterium]|nr:O-antigen ligase family protein [Fimbriimonadaceae bacterium]